jgi:hypothetical protein
MYTRAAWRRTRQHWIAQRLPCSVCGQAIDYDHGRYLADGSLNLRSFVCGHVVDRRIALARGWTAEQADALANTRPECAACSNRAGARAGNRAQRARMIKRKDPTAWVVSTRW